MIEGSGIRTGDTLEAAAVEALCGTRDATDALGVVLDQVLLVLKDIRQELRDQRAKGDELTERFEQIASAVCDAGRNLEGTLGRRDTTVR